MHRLGMLLRKPHRRLRWVVAALGLLLLLLLIGWRLWERRQFAEARTALEEDRFEDARRHLAWSLRFWPSDAEVYLFAARLERSANNLPAAAAFLDECEKLRGPSSATQLERDLLHAETGELAEAEANLRSVAHEGPETNLILEVLARLAMRERRLGKAQDALEQWLQRDPDSARAWYWLGWVHRQRGFREEALAAYRQALELQPNRWRAALDLANLYMELKRFALAEPYLDQLRATHPDQPEVLYASARMHAYRSEGDEARRDLDRLLEAHPDHVDGLVLRGKIEREAGQPALAEDHVKRALALRPKDIEGLYQYYRCLQTHPERLKEAAGILAQYESLRHDRDHLDMLLRTDLQQTPDDPELAVEIARLLQNLGNDAAAVEWYYRALRKNPALEKAHEALLLHFEKIGDAEHATEHRNELARLRGKHPGVP
jgi:tetratricopeptide (TPR) repeat protein